MEPHTSGAAADQGVLALRSARCMRLHSISEIHIISVDLLQKEVLICICGYAIVRLVCGVAEWRCDFVVCVVWLQVMYGTRTYVQYVW